MDNFSTALSFLQVNGYIAMLILMLFEGPIVTCAAAFAASLGYFNIYLVFILSIFGNLIPDTLAFFIGRFSRGLSIERYSSYFGLTKKKVFYLEKKIKRHTIKTLLFTKLVPPFPVPGIILAGFLKIKFVKFFLIDLFINISFAITFCLVGFYFGTFSKVIFDYLKIGNYLFIVFILFLALAYFIIKFIYRKTSRIKF